MIVVFELRVALGISIAAINCDMGNILFKLS